jgi:peptidoglycan/LPS O-acetylase OafA/YrhL
MVMAIKYRPDIDGLRAIAVLAVLGFHAFPRLCAGGFVGVDIFFVISGYLISSIIFEEVATGRFTYAGFYARRIRRIFPSLVTVLIAVLIVGFFLDFSTQFARLGTHVAAGAAFLSNFVLWREAGYFDIDAAYKPLLHLWSLGVEEQFYIVWPLMIAALSGRRILWVVAAVLLVSFTTNIVIVRSHPTAAFFLPATRFWELMIGSLLAYSAHAGLFGSCRPMGAAAQARAFSDRICPPSRLTVFDKQADRVSRLGRSGPHARNCRPHRGWPRCANQSGVACQQGGRICRPHQLPVVSVALADSVLHVNQ